MKSLGKKLIEFIDTDELIKTQVSVGRLTHQPYANYWWPDEAEAKLNQFLKEQSDPRLKDAKNEIESLRMELRETRKVLQNAQEEICENELLLESARIRDDDELSGFRTE